MIDVIPLGKKTTKSLAQSGACLCFSDIYGRSRPMLRQLCRSIDTLNTNLNYFCFWRQIIIKELCTLYI